MKCGKCGIDIEGLQSICPNCGNSFAVSAPGFEGASDRTKVTGQSLGTPTQFTPIVMIQPLPIQKNEESTPTREIRALLAEATELQSSYESAYDTFRRNEATVSAIGEVGANLAKSTLGISKKTSNKVLKARQNKWERSLEYSNLRERFRILFEKTGELLKATSENSEKICPPGNSYGLLRMLNGVHKAVRLDTKINRFIEALDNLSTKDLIFNEDIPPADFKPKKQVYPRADATRQTHSLNEYCRTDSPPRNQRSHTKINAFLDAIVCNRDLCLTLGATLYIACISIFVGVELATVDAPSLYELGRFGIGEDFILATMHLILGAMGILGIGLGIIGFGRFESIS
ncbi:MAG: hypothetical protein E4H14_05785 [Candidatus Thorarchaeota archaeon]|nr:MAG: hypothetical protein E4H14_05785 [Candidatus Thorarchaeota archaeon]